MKLKTTLLIASATVLAGCLSPVKNDPPASFVVNTVPRNLPVTETKALTMLVLPAETRPIYQTVRMAYTVRPYQVQYFGENQWAETPSEMLTPLLVQTLQNTKHYRAVVMAPYSGVYNYALNTRILRFEQDYMHKPHSFKLTARVSINRLATNQVVAIKEFVISVPITTQSPYNGVIAANTATRQLLLEIAKFSLQNT